MMMKFNEMHMVNKSPWPILSSLQIWSLMVLTIFNNQFKNKKNSITIMIITLMVTSLTWWNNTIKETTMEGFHQMKTKNAIKKGMLMFILSEVMFFTSFFWSYFHASISPNIEIGQMWPPNEIKSFNPINVPLLNTIILISSGFSITWSHHLMLENKMEKSKLALMVTLLMGTYFSMLQAMEYNQSEFTMMDSSYGNIFFMATGFHGLHVMVGSTFIMFNVIKMKKMILDSKNHMMFELAAWYWHFVDVVWLFLYMSIYWWGK